MKSCHLQQHGIDLEDILQREISQTEKQITYAFTYMWNLKNETNEQTKQTETDS